MEQELPTIHVVLFVDRIVGVFATSNDADRYIFAVAGENGDSAYTIAEYPVQTFSGDYVPYCVDLYYDGSVRGCFINGHGGTIQDVWTRIVAGKPYFLRVECWAKTDNEAIATAQSERSRYLAQGRLTPHKKK